MDSRNISTKDRMYMCQDCELSWQDHSETDQHWNVKKCPMCKKQAEDKGLLSQAMVDLLVGFKQDRGYCIHEEILAQLEIDMFYEWLKR